MEWVSSMALVVKLLASSCLENPMDRGAWWVTVHGVTKSWMLLKWLSMHACILEEAEPLVQCDSYLYRLPRCALKNLPASIENSIDVGLIPRLGRSPGEGNGNPLQYSCLENPMRRGAWRATIHGGTRVGHDWVTKPLTANYYYESVTGLPVYYLISHDRR